MDNSSDRYLHKKFKKQQCLSSSTTASAADNRNAQQEQRQSNDKVAPKAKEDQRSPLADASRRQEQCDRLVNVSCDKSDRNVSVPNAQSTNNGSLNANGTTTASSVTLTSSSASSYSLIKSSSISSNVAGAVTASPIISTDGGGRFAAWNPDHQSLGNHYHSQAETSSLRSFASSTASSSIAGNYKYSSAAGSNASNNNQNNSCISYVISNPSSRVVESTTSFTRDPASFDNIKFNNAYDLTSSSSTSSILENSYSNNHQYHYVVSGNNRELVRNEENANQEASELQMHEQNQRIKRDDGDMPEKVTDGTQQDKTSAGKYVCNYCNLVCSKPSVLQKHIRAHTNERPFPCISCGFSFKTRSNLYKHCRSRTHANRVMGNKAQEMTNEVEVVEKSDMQQSLQNEIIMEENRNIPSDMKTSQDVKQKPYKPRFKAVLDNSIAENVDTNPKMLETQKSTNSDLLSLRIDELIHKNNSIVLVGSNDQYMFKRRNVENNYVEGNHDYRYKEPYSPNNNVIIDHRNEDEPLNLTYKNRKRSMSEIAEPTVQKSLIKELLLKNLYADSNKQCPHCKMIFQTVTELDLHKLRSCKGYSKSGARYSRSSSVNVASILTQNKNAFDTNPHIPTAVFPLKSPGPFLGKTRLVESDKSKSFSFDDSIQTTNFQSTFPNTHDMIKTRYSISPLTLPNDKSKKPPVKMFGGEVKITHTSGETKSFKIDGKDERYERNYTEYGGNLSENRVVKSTLQSGGTVLHNKSGGYHTKPDQKRSGSPEVIRVYENSNISPSIEMMKAKFNFSRPEVIVDQNKAIEIPISANNVTSSSYKYTNIMDYSQNAIRQFTPKLKQPNLSIPGIPVPSKIVLPQRAPLFIDTKSEKPAENWQKLDVSPMPAFPKDLDATDRRNSENIDFAQKQILLQQKMTSEPPKLQAAYNPMNFLVNGKIIRYVPGIPGPITADPLSDMAYSNSIAAVSPRPFSGNHLQKPNVRVTPMETKSIESYSPKSFQERPPIELNKSPKLQSTLTVKTDLNTRSNEMRSPKAGEMKSPKMNDLKSPKSAESKSPVIKSPQSSLTPSSGETPKKFARPNSLAIKPMMPGTKQHHGLTPTVFNQILISPDTPRVAKKYNHQILHGNYFSYLGLKSSTKPTYCTLNKTQPFYVPHFKKLSMYSEWTQRDTKTDKLFLSAYDSRQKHQMYTTAGMAKADLIIHSSYKFTLPEPSSASEEPAKSILGGYESNDDYTYIRGRGRGRYVCDQCGIRCKKPSMLKKHIRTHSNDRPYTCSHCNFSFKTKGNLTKHMKSKAHTKNYAAYNSSSSSSSSAQQSGTPSSESDTDDSGMDSSDESSTRHQEREAVFGLLSLSQKPAVSENRNTSPNSSSDNGLASFMDTEQIAHVSKTNYAKNKILDQAMNFNTAKLSEISFSTNAEIQEKQKLSQFLGKTNTTRPLTYPYTNASPQEAPSPAILTGNKEVAEVKTPVPSENTKLTINVNDKNDPTKQFNVVKKYGKYPNSSSYKVQPEDPLPFEDNQPAVPKQTYVDRRTDDYESRIRSIQVPETPQNVASDLRKRKGSLDHDAGAKIQKNDSEVMDLSVTSNLERKNQNVEVIVNGFVHNQEQDPENSGQTLMELKKSKDLSNMIIQMSNTGDRMGVTETSAIYSSINEEIRHPQENANVIPYENEHNPSKEEAPMEVAETNHVNINYVMHDQPNTTVDQGSFKQTDYDNSAMETLADIATKQEKLEKNSIAKNVATEFLKLAIKNECQNSDGLKESNFISSNKDVNELIGKPEENKSCTICSKSFCKPSQLKLHMNIHYLERPYRCDSCSVSFRTKGHLQKHERSASHHNKLSSSPNLSSSEPRPFKCSDCNIAFRIHGHLAKHLRAKMHIMKLECLNKIPFGLYAELERSNSLLTEINTTDGDQCLESLKILAKKVFTNDPSKLNQLGPSPTESIDTDS
ncbi:hypothetical protein Trydic_g3887 [Trypoxylus dichotomus]